MGITVTPIPAQVLWSFKSDGRAKVWMVASGHPGFAVPGVHFDKVFAVAPGLEASRLFIAIATMHHMIQLFYDVRSAYLAASLLESECVPLRYPVEQRE